MNDTSLNPDQIEIEAEYYFKQDDNGSPSLFSVQMEVQRVLAERGYDILNRGERVWDFISQHHVPDPSLWWRIKDRMGLVHEADRLGQHAIENLRETRDDRPYVITFRFIPVQWENGDEGYSVEMEAIPTLSEKMERLDGDFSDASPERAVRKGKRELRNIATEVGFATAREPFTRSENYRDTLTSHLRQELQGYQYGDSVVNFTDEGDEAFRYSLFRPALCGYVHAIEWAIICYIEHTEGRDIIEEEGYGRGPGFPNLIDEIEGTGAVTQTTSDTLRDFNDERIWMAHHKSGPVTDIDVHRVKQRHGILLEELFL